MDNKALSFIMAKRLKELRESRGLSYSKLSNELTETYHDHNNPQKEGGDDEARKTVISRDSLINYEVDEIPHSKAYANNGMSVENLRYLCDFYGVSADYLLGLTDVKTADNGVKSILKSTHLTEEAAESLASMKSVYALTLLDDLLICPHDIIDQIGKRYIVYQYAKKSIIPQARELGAEDTDFLPDIKIGGIPLPDVPLKDLEEYTRFEFYRAIVNFTEYKRKDNNA